MDIYPFLAGPTMRPSGEVVDRASIVCLFTHFRLLQTCERAGHEDSLESIDAVLGCPIGLFEVGTHLADAFEALSRKNVVLSSMLYSVSWCVQGPALPPAGAPSRP